MNPGTIIRRIQALFTTGRLKAYNDNPAEKKGRPSLAEFQFSGLDGELRDKRENYVPYGFTHWPRSETSEPLILAENGEKAHSMGFCIADRYYRILLNAEGEVALHDDQGQWVWLKRDEIEIRGKHIKAIAETARIDAQTTINGDLTVQGKTTLNGSLTVNGGVDINGTLRVNGVAMHVP